MKQLGKILSLVMAVAVLAGLTVVSVPAAQAAGGKTYYVDPAGGKDTNTGTSASAAWKSLDKVNATTFSAGDSILLKKGSSFTGLLFPKGSGAKGNPITIGSYGSGAKPVIRANNAQKAAAVYLQGQDHWVIDGIEVVNYNQNSDRYGIFIDSSRGWFEDITIRNCAVHGIDGDASDRVENTSSYGGMTGIWVKPTTGSFDTILIENNEVYETIGSGIVVNGNSTAAAEKVVIRNNYLHQIGKDGILILNCVGALVEYNVVNESHNYSTTYHVAMWPFSSNDSVFQYNEAYNTRTTKDGHGFDSDYYCKNTVFQYNYGHDNEGGFILICCEPEVDWSSTPTYNDGTIVRYNIGQNNANVQFMIVGNITNTQIYNNTIYVGENVKSHIVNHYSRNGKAYPDKTYFYNNIIYNMSGGEYSFGKSTNTKWSNNAFFGQHPASEPADTNKVTADPMCMNPGGAATGLKSCTAYQLSKQSPCIEAGRTIRNSGAKDFFGNPVSGRPNIGAYGGKGIAGAVVAPGTTARPTSPTGGVTPTGGQAGTTKAPVVIGGTTAPMTDEGGSTAAGTTAPQTDAAGNTLAPTDASTNAVSANPKDEDGSSNTWLIVLIVVVAAVAAAGGVTAFVVIKKRRQQ